MFFFQSNFFSSVYKCFLYEQIVVYAVLKMSVLMFEFIDVGCSRQIIIMTIKNASFSTGRQSKRLYRCVPQCTFRRPNLPCTTRRINCRSCFTLTVVLYFVFKKSICRRSKKGGTKWKKLSSYTFLLKKRLLGFHLGCKWSRDDSFCGHFAIRDVEEIKKEKKERWWILLGPRVASLKWAIVNQRSHVVYSADLIGGSVTSIRIVIKGPWCFATEFES